jgi:dipeptidyl aminopeptidase/acylaminoacyl peptidase
MAPEGKIKALLCEYPMTDYLKRSPQATLPDGQPFPPPGYIDKHVASIAPGTVISSSVPPQRMPLTFTLAAYGRWQDYYGTDKKLYPITAVEEVTHFPPTFIIHGKQDVAVSVEDSRKFVYKLGEVLGEKIKENIRLAIVDGDHGFDIDLVEEETGWLKDGLKWLEEKWLDG